MKTLTIYNSIDEAKKHLKDFEKQLGECNLLACYDTILDRMGDDIEEFVFEEFGLRNFWETSQIEIKCPKNDGEYTVTVNINAECYGFFNNYSRPTIHTKETIQKGIITKVFELMNYEKEYHHTYSITKDLVNEHGLILYSINEKLYFCFGDHADLLGEFINK